VDAIKAAHGDADVNIYAADHGFNCDQRGSYDAASRDLARQRTDAFYAKNLA
jgi:carboxymethylenebutenolidase